MIWKHWNVAVMDRLLYRKRKFGQFKRDVLWAFVWKSSICLVGLFFLLFRSTKKWPFFINESSKVTLKRSTFVPICPTNRIIFKSRISYNIITKNLYTDILKMLLVLRQDSKWTSKSNFQFQLFWKVGMPILPPLLPPVVSSKKWLTCNIFFL